MMVPMLDHAMERAAAAGAEEVVIGMAHRGRLNMLVHALGRPYERIIAEFEGVQGAVGSTGDVKYHLGAEGGYRTRSGREIGVRMAPNPSHLEYVDPVVEGIARARQTDRARPQSRRDEDLVLPVLIHGDAAFAGQGVVAETLNLAELDGYRTGGTLHLIANNQIGFTTGPHDARSTRFASDLAKGFDIPIFHVNADDAEACLAVMRLAADFRERFHADVVIDLVGYRRYGHNEGDEPAYTQPVLYARIAEHPTVRAIWAERLVAAGVVTAEEAEAMRERAHERLVEAQRKVREAIESQASAGPLPVEAESLEAPVDTAVDAARLVALDRALHRWPESFTVNPKLARQLARRAQALEQDGPIDWAHAEALALGTLLQDGVPVRMTGQDTERGTFSQRHLVLHDVKTGERWCALGALEDAQGSFELHNSPLSEMAALGFEYGYSVASPGALVIWEAQFGDFANGAQVIIDQFLSAGRAKWGQASRLTLLLPHGYEGQGPEHSSARIERFLQLAAEDNLRVVNATTPAPYFHLLRRQARLEERRPLVVFTPKSLLRHPRAVSRLRDLAGGRFELVIDDAAARERADEVRRIVLCAGKVYYDLIGSEQRDGAGAVAVARLEQLYPFPEAELAALLGSYPNAEELVWVQEEPLNMGAWRYLEPRLRPLAAAHLQLASIGRPDRAAPAEGYAAMHQRQQAVIVEQALGSPARRRRKARTA
jgi:2-oxoglutarate dehydrogenase E1 component